jgi:pyridinium-3,5-bisthiocarboxylic acid mononucleotide nickel chelatase
MRVDRVGLGAGGRDPVDRPNVVRLVVGDASGVGDAWLLVEANFDDLDPRLWPGVLDTLLASGAADAWLTPIVMKKGRPAHTVSALTTADRVDDVRRVLFVETSTIGARTTPVDKTALNRDWVEVVVAGQRVRVKVARLDGAAVSVNPEWDDVSAAATATGRAAKDVLADATSAARQLLG